MSQDSFGTRDTLSVGDDTYEIFRLERIPGADRLPFSKKILLENLLRNEDGRLVTRAQIEELLIEGPAGEARGEVRFSPGRVIMQDFTALAALVDLAALRDAVRERGGDPRWINPRIPAELVVDHSVAADAFGSAGALARNIELEYERNAERYAFFRWAEQTFDGLSVVPPGAGIVHQVNLEYLARVVAVNDGRASFDTLVGIDSHSTMVNGLGVLGWGVGGIEAEAAMLGQPIALPVPEVVGCKLTGRIAEGAMATDVVLTLTERLRQEGVVGSFVEFWGPGVAALSAPDRCTISNMSPEYGSTCALFPIDAETIAYLALTGRSGRQLALIEAYARGQGLWHEGGDVAPADYDRSIEFDLGAISSTMAGPRRPQDRLSLADVPAEVGRTVRGGEPADLALAGGAQIRLADGDVVIAAITSCTNTSNPTLMVAAGLLARNAVRAGLSTRPWVKTTLAPGSRVVIEYLTAAGLMPDLEALGFHLTAFGCTTCAGNSGPLDPAISAAVASNDLTLAAVLSGNRNFEGRIHPDARMSFLASPPLVVAYAIAGSTALDLTADPLGTTADGEPVYLRDVWPSSAEIAAVVVDHVGAKAFERGYQGIYDGDEHWRALPSGTGDSYDWDADSTYVRRPPYFDEVDLASDELPPPRDIVGARALVVLGDSITTDHISPAGAIAASSPAGIYLRDHGVERSQFNILGARRGNHDVMVRGTFANIRLRNALADGAEGGVTRLLPDGEIMTIFDAAQRYALAGVPLIVLAGRDYGSGSSRDWAAKGAALLGVRVVLAESFERIHRWNLVGMGVLPLQFLPGDTAASLGLTGHESFSVTGIAAITPENIPPTVRIRADDREFDVRVRLDTSVEVSYLLNGGVLQYILREEFRLHAPASA